MPAEFHHLSPVILTDEMFDELMPNLTINPTDGQKNHAYLIAEQSMVRALKTPLIPTQISGSFGFPYPYEPIILPHVYVRSVDDITAYALNRACDCSTIDVDACAILRNYYGYIDYRIISSYYYRACGRVYAPFQFDITYTAGLTTGTAANDSSLHMGLSMLARNELLEMLDPGGLEGGMGDPGVQSYSSVGYSETRVELDNTPFGTSAVANRVWKLVQHLYIPRPLRF